MKKSILSVILAVMMVILASCGSSTDQGSEPATADSTTLEEGQFDGTDAEQEEQGNVASYSGETQPGGGPQSPGQEKKEPIIMSAEPFSGGYGWIRLKDSEENNWKCVDVNGNVVFERKCSNVSSFINGYAVIDKAIIIDSVGDELYDFGAEGYELIDTRPLDVGCVILSKDIDTYEKSGTFSYVLDIEKKTITEMDFSDSTYFTASKEWGEFYKGYDYYKVDLYDYLGRGYYTLGMKKFDKLEGYPSSYRMIQWYDVKNNRYVNIDSGIEFQDEDHGNALLYFRTKDPDIYCVYFTQQDKIFFIDTSSCSIVNTLDGFMPCRGYYYSLTDVYPDDYLAFCADSERVWMEWDEGECWYLDFNTQEKFQMTPEFDEYEILAYNGEYFCLSLKNDIGTYYLAVVDKGGKTVLSPVQYSQNSKFKPCFWGEHLIYYFEGEMHFVSMSDWKTEAMVEMQITVDDANERMCLMDVTAPDVKYIIDFNTDSIYRPDGSAVAVDMERSPLVDSTGTFYSKILVFDFYEQAYSYLNNDLTEFIIKY